MPREPLARFAEKVEFTPGCWEWTATRQRKGYGQFRDGTMRQAHRWLWEATVGPVPTGLELDHLCRNRACVNPDHLEVVTHAENVARIDEVAKSASQRAAWAAWRAARPECPQGHEFTPENTATGRDGGRICRQCRKDRSREWRERNRDRYLAMQKESYRRRRDAASTSKFAN